MARTADQLARRVIRATGNPHLRYVPGSLRINGNLMTWTERCRPRCRHDDGSCHVARCATTPTADRPERKQP